MASASVLPSWLYASWSRNYIKRAGAGGVLGAADSSVSVRYIQTEAAGHAFDIRIADDFSLPETVRSIDDLDLTQLQLLASGAVECFAGVTLAPAENTFAWHAAFLFPPSIEDAPPALLAVISAGEHETSDIGIAQPDLPSSRGKPVTRWLEFAPDKSYEEEWVMLDGYFKQGAHLAIVPTSHLRRAPHLRCALLPAARPGLPCASARAQARRRCSRGSATA